MRLNKTLQAGEVRDSLGDDSVFMEVLTSVA